MAGGLARAEGQVGRAPGLGPRSRGGGGGRRRAGFCVPSWGRVGRDENGAKLDRGWPLPEDG